METGEVIFDSSSLAAEALSGWHAHADLPSAFLHLHRAENCHTAADRRDCITGVPSIGPVFGSQVLQQGQELKEQKVGRKTGLR